LGSSHNRQQTKDRKYLKRAGESVRAHARAYVFRGQNVHSCQTPWSASRKCRACIQYLNLSARVRPQSRLRACNPADRLYKRGRRVGAAFDIAPQKT
jgi:hypothetical protein